MKQVCSWVFCNGRQTDTDIKKNRAELKLCTGKRNFPIFQWQSCRNIEKHKKDDHTPRVIVYGPSATRYMKDRAKQAFQIALKLNGLESTTYFQKNNITRTQITINDLIN
jgi:hypothetical protein